MAPEIKDGQLPDTDRGWDAFYGRADDGRQFVTVVAGHRGTELIVPPAGEHYAFDQNIWARRVHVTVSPKGRSVRVWVDGREVTSDDV